MFSTAGPFWEAGARELPARTKIPRFARNDKAFGWALMTARNSMRLPLGAQTPLSVDIFAQADTEDKKLRKDPLEVLALKVPFGNRSAFPNEVPWPGQLRTQRSLKT